MTEPLTLDHINALGRIDTCAVSNAIETFNVQLRNEGYADGRVRCMLPRSSSMVGYAVTAKIRCSSPPPDRHAYPDRTDWWNHILTVPAPRVVVVQDVDDLPGTGAVWGEVHANILMALGCVGAVTNGAVRDLPSIWPTGFHLFAGSVAVSHAYVHIVETGGPVEIGGLKVSPGVLIHGDQHGLLRIPESIAAGIPAAVARLKEREKEIIGLCRGRDFSLDRLRKAVDGEVEIASA